MVLLWFFVCFMILLWVCDFFAALVLRSCGCVPVVSLDVFLCLWRVCFFLCVCVMDCGGPVWADLRCVYYMWFWLWFG